MKEEAIACEKLLIALYFLRIMHKKSVLNQIIIRR